MIKQPFDAAPGGYVRRSGSKRSQTPQRDGFTGTASSDRLPDPLIFGGISVYEDTMAYKFKPSKSVAKRFGVTKTGKLKRHHSLTSHLRSGRSAKKKRHLRRPEILFEGHARNMRQLMGISKLKPARVAHERAQAASQAAAAEATE